MHLHHPSLTTTGKKKGKQKFRNAEQARLHRELEENWNDLKKKWGVTKNTKKMVKNDLYIPKINPRLEENRKYNSLVTTWEPCTKKPSPTYTGDKIIGIGTMHKSNAVPIFSDGEAKEISKMRR
jgi:hypothetical protein